LFARGEQLLDAVGKLRTLGAARAPKKAWATISQIIPWSAGPQMSHNIIQKRLAFWYEQSVTVAATGEGHCLPRILPEIILARAQSPWPPRLLPLLLSVGCKSLK
jgi:hypothetical protein